MFFSKTFCCNKFAKTKKGNYAFACVAKQIYNIVIEGLNYKLYCQTYTLFIQLTYLCSHIDLERERKREKKKKGGRERESKSER